MRHWNQVSQLKLFDWRQDSLADDERGRITYTPDFVDAETAQAWFRELRSAVAWRAERRDMYDREVDVPRLLGSFRLDPAPAATPSLGATRRMTIRAKAPPRRPIHVDLEPGSLLVMDYDTQIHYTHGVPKTHAAVGERISLAFRVKAGQSPPKVLHR